MNKSFFEANLNTVLMTIVLGTIGWIGFKSTEGTNTLARFEERATAVTATLLRLEKTLGETVTRREFDQVQAEQGRIQVRLRELDIDFINLKANLVRMQNERAVR